jgi:hypothetical protein
MLINTTKLSVMLILISIGCLTFVFAQTRQPLPEGQKVTQEELDTHFGLARSLAEERKFEQALKEYLFVFDNSRDVSGYGGVRLSYVPSEIAAMARVYRPALLALQFRRDEREKLVLVAKADFDAIHELTTLNESLGEAERNIALFDMLKTKGPLYTDLRDALRMLIWKQLVEAKRYSDLKESIDGLAKQVASQIAESAINNDFPDRSVLSSPQYQGYLHRTVIEDGGRVYETLLGLAMIEKADKLTKWMLTFSSEGEMYARLINSAINANRTDIAADWIERAIKTLRREDDLRLVREAAKRLGKTN